MTAPTADLDRLAQLLSRRIGLRVDRLTRERLARAVQRSGRDADEYARRAEDDPRALDELVDLVTVQESAFFRHPEHFDALSEHLRSPEALALPPAERVIWSAGCANGEEAWSLAMLLEELASDWRVVATDVSRGALVRAQAGVYTERRAAALGPVRTSRFLRPAGDGRVEIAGFLRRRVEFAHHNLSSGWAPLEAGPCAVVFCRNVLIYLRGNAQRRLLDDLRDRMPPGGLLVMGGAESIAPTDPAFAPQQRSGCYVYRPRPADAPAAAGPTPPVVRRPAKRPRRTTRPAAALQATLEPSAADHVAAGERLAAGGDHGGAIGAFRRATYLEPDDPMHHVRLGLALERAGDEGARRAFRAAQAALARADRRRLEPALDGWSVGELERMLAGRTGSGAVGP